MIDVQNVTKEYFGSKSNAKKILDKVSFKVGPQKTIAILGPNGSGKTTLTKILAGLDHPTKGRVVNHQKAGLVFQNHFESLFPWQTVEQNIKFALRKESKNKREVDKNCKKILKKFNLLEHRGKYPYQLSGGLSQLTAIARTLAFNPKFFLLDEPFSALDYYTSLKLQQQLAELIEELKIPTVIITHSVDEAIFLADEIVIFSNLPARVIKVIKNDLPRPRKLDHVNLQSFHEIKSEVLGSIKSFLV